MLWLTNKCVKIYFWDVRQRGAFQLDRLHLVFPHEFCWTHLCGSLHCSALGADFLWSHATRKTNSTSDNITQENQGDAFVPWLSQSNGSDLPPILLQVHVATSVFVLCCAGKCGFLSSCFLISRRLLLGGFGLGSTSDFKSPGNI